MGAWVLSDRRESAVRGHSRSGRRTTGIVAALALAVVLGAAPAPAIALTFGHAPGSPFSGAPGTGQQSLAVADVDSDGIPDLSTANGDTNDLGIMIATGTGAFTQAASPSTSGNGPRAVAAADFDGDGRIDLAAANSASNNVAVLLGDGSGAFDQAGGSPFSVGADTAPVAVATGDFDGDGSADVATANAADDSVSVLLGNGSGGLAAAGAPVPVGAHPVAVAAADLNGDGQSDVAAANEAADSVSILLGDGAGGLTATAPAIGLASATLPASVAAGEVNGDGQQDLVIANTGTSNVSVLLGDGTGAFAAAAGTPTAVVRSPTSVAVGDFDGDGRTDVAAAGNGADRVSVLLGNGAGAFQPAGPFLIGDVTGPVSVAVGDFNDDGRPDLATANIASGGAAVLLNQTGGFTAPSPGSVVISELRFAGPSGDGDQFVELYNTSTTATSVGGWSLQGSNGRAVSIPPGTVLPPLGHLLLTGPPNLAAGYSLNAYGPSSLQLPFGAGGALRIPASGGGVRLRSPQGTTIDAAGFTGAPASHTEGTPIAPPPPSASDDQFAFVRRASAGAPVDTGDNAADFVQVRAGPGAGQAASGTPVLGAPAPQGLPSPTQHNDILQSSLLDRGVGVNAAPNFVFTPGAPGSMIVNRRLTNCSGQPSTGPCAFAPERPPTVVRRLRFRISELTTIGTPGSGLAILIAESSPGATAVPISFAGGGGVANVSGLALDAPPSAPGMGGVGSSFTATALLPSGGLAPGQSINVQFAFSVTQTGRYRFGYDAEDDLEPYVEPDEPTAPTEQPDLGGAPVAPAGAVVEPLTAGAVTETGATATAAAPATPAATRQACPSKAARRVRPRGRRPSPRVPRTARTQRAGRRARTRPSGRRRGSPGSAPACARSIARPSKRPKR